MPQDHLQDHLRKEGSRGTADTLEILARVEGQDSVSKKLTSALIAGTASTTPSLSWVFSRVQFTKKGFSSDHNLLHT